METQTGNGILEEFRIEFQDCWHRVPNKGIFMILLGAWLVLFHVLGNSTLGYVSTPSLFLYLFDALSGGGRNLMESEEGFGLLVPVIVLGILWVRRKELIALEFRTWSPAMLCIASGSALHVLGYVVQQPRISVVGFFTGLYGLGGVTWGRAWMKAVFFPFFLFVFCVPLGSLAVPITFRLRLLVCQLVEFISHYILSIDLLREGSILKDPSGRYQYEVAAACSGIKSQIATLGIAVILAFFSLKSWWRRVLLIVSAFPLAVLGNLLRMMAIVIAAEIGGQEYGNVVHEGGPAGVLSLLPYLPAFVGLLLLEGWLREPQPNRLPKPVEAPAT